jgi:Swi5-dependent recombination DNA repair protein 1
LRTQLDTAKQALRLEQSARDAELEGLVSTWTSATRAAAEELFAVAKDRVNAMGGLQAWRDQERDSRERWRENWREGNGEQRERDDADDDGDGDGDGDSAEKPDERAEGDVSVLNYDRLLHC